MEVPILNIEETIEKAMYAALSGEELDRQTIIDLLGIDPDSETAEKLGECARKVAYEVTGNRGKVWASIGVDYEPCKMNCSFCSFGEKWGTVKEAYSWSDDEIISFAGRLASQGAEWIALRTTERFELGRLCKLAYKVRESVSGGYRLLANTGEANARMTKELQTAGFEVIYHPIRLREGVDTAFNIEERRKTLAYIQGSSMDLAYWVEPIGPEHTNEELADALLLSLECGVRLSGAMARVPVEGTPLYKHGEISERRLAQIGAVVRLASGRRAVDVCVHPPSQLAMDWGANVVVVDVGAVPRESSNMKEEWNGFDMAAANEKLLQAGYDMLKK